MIKAILKNEVSYHDLSGKVKLIKEGTPINIQIVRRGSTFLKVNGEYGITRKDKYLGIYEDQVFDLAPNEFKTVD